jgi:hypothetical protein
MTDLVAANGRARSVVGWSCAGVALSLAFVCARAAQTENRAGLIGLLKLPQLVGSEFCREPPRREVALYAAPESADIVGWIRADKHSSSDADCYRVVLNVYRRADGSVRELPTEEYEEEEPHAAIVVEARGRWLKLRLDDGEAWVETSDPNQYLSLEQLLSRRPAYLTQAWDGTLAATPGGVSQIRPADPRRRVIGYIVPVLEMLQVTLAPGQDSEETRRQYDASSIRSSRGPNGTHILFIERGTWVSAFERPDPGAPVVARFKTDTCDQALRSTSANPPDVPVFARRSGWLQVALRRETWKDEPRAWIEESPVWRFHALAADAEREKFEDEVFGRELSSVRFLRSRAVHGRLWLEVEVMSHTIYESVDPPTVVATGWVPAHDRAGELVVWAYSRD